MPPLWIMDIEGLHLRRKKMNRFEQRLQKRLQNEEIASGYQEMVAELELMRAIDTKGSQRNLHLNKPRKEQHIWNTPRKN